MTKEKKKELLEKTCKNCGCNLYLCYGNIRTVARINKCSACNKRKPPYIMSYPKITSVTSSYLMHVSVEKFAFLVNKIIKREIMLKV